MQERCCGGQKRPLQRAVVVVRLPRPGEPINGPTKHNRCDAAASGINNQPRASQYVFR